MKITKSNALSFAKKCIKQAESISSYVRQSLEVDKKSGVVRNYKDDFTQIDQLNLLANKAINLLKNPSQGFSFSDLDDKPGSIVIETFSVSEFGNQDDMDFFHKTVLAIQKNENVSYSEALDIMRFGRK